MMTEQRYNWTMDILAWCHGRYTEEQLNRLTMPELSEVYAEIYFRHLVEVG